MNQHKDLLYRQKYATYQLNNRTFSTQNTKISARSLTISYICFQVRIVKKKKGGEAILSTTTEHLVTPAPPTRALYAKLQREKLHFLSLLTTILKALICWKLESFRGLCPLGPRQGLRRAPGPTRMRRAVRFTHTRCATRTDFSAHPFFANPGSATVHIPLARPSRLPPEASILGELGSSRPPPPQWKYWGGANIVLPPPPIISSKIDNM